MTIDVFLDQGAKLSRSGVSGTRENGPHTLNSEHDQLWKRIRRGLESSNGKQVNIHTRNVQPRNIVFRFKLLDSQYWWLIR